MPMTDENRGTNADGSRSEDYCMYCYKNGAFTQDFTMGQMIEFCLQFLNQWNAQAGCNLTPIQAKEQMLQYFPRLKRWKEKDERTLAEKSDPFACPMRKRDGRFHGCQRLSPTSADVQDWSKGLS